LLKIKAKISLARQQVCFFKKKHATGLFTAVENLFNCSFGGKVRTFDESNNSNISAFYI
jgi:hypothetical protein